MYRKIFYVFFIFLSACTSKPIVPTPTTIPTFNVESSNFSNIDITNQVFTPDVVITPIPPAYIPIYPLLPGKGIVLNLDNFDQSQAEYREIAFLIQIVTDYDNNHPEVLGDQPADQEINSFKLEIKNQISQSEFAYLLDRTYKKSASETLTFDYYLNEFIGKYFNYYNQSTQKNELVQCLGWQTFIGDLIFAHYNFPVAALGHYPLDYPNGILNLDHGDIHLQNTNDLNLVQKGDTFNYGRHTGLILNKYLYEGSFYFLVTEANSPKGANEYYKPTGQPVLYLTDTLKFLNAIGVENLTLARPNNRFQVVVDPEVPTGKILELIKELK